MQPLLETIVHLIHCQELIPLKSTIFLGNLIGVGNGINIDLQSVCFTTTN